MMGEFYQQERDAKRRRYAAVPPQPAPPEAEMRNARLLFDDPDQDNPKAQIWICVGKSTRGKSHFAEWLIRSMHAHPDKKRRWVFGLVFSGSLYTSAYDWIPKNARVEGFDEERLQRHLESLKSMFRAGKKLPQSFIWLDDLMGVLESDSKVFMHLITTARHLGINIIICAQYLAKGINTTLRAQTNYALMWGTKQHRSIELLHKEFGQLFASKARFEQYLHDATETPYAAVCYSERCDSLEKNYNVLRAPAKLPQEALEFSMGEGAPAPQPPRAGVPDAHSRRGDRLAKKDQLQRQRQDLVPATRHQKKGQSRGDIARGAFA